MTDFLHAPVTTLAFCWRLRRRDGVALGFTTHDRDLVIDGLTYSAAPGMLPSAIAWSDGLEADSMDLSGALTNDAITEADLAAGRWDGAELRLLAVDWEAPGGEQLFLARGELGTVSQSGREFTAELKGPATRLDRPVAELTSPDCRARLGDKRCRVDLAPLTRISEVVAVLDESMVDIADAEPVANAYADGSLRWVTGANSGLDAAILRSNGVRLTLRDPVAEAVAEGDRVEIVQGCDKIFATCRDRFANAENFRGEPHLPGNDLLTRYPGAG